ncbi:MAG: PAS domain S-box protein [Desulfobacterales bacterium]|nr:PAS domain S-box protein [Desulfobacterales bacterium]
MKYHNVQDERLTGRLRRLLFVRVFITSFLLGISLFIQLTGTTPTLSSISPFLYSVIVSSYILSLVFVGLGKIIKQVYINVYIQVFCDISLISLLVYATGGIMSIYSIFYPLVIIYSTLFLSKRGGLIIASLCGLFLGFLLNLEYYQVIHPIYLEKWDYHFTAGYVLARMFIHILSFYIVALLVSFIVQQEASTRELLSKKENEFAQLDLLHKRIVDSATSGIVTMDLYGYIKSFNRSAEEITEYPFAIVENKHVDVFFSGLYAIIKEKAIHGSLSRATMREEMVIYSKNQQKKRVIGYSVSPLMDNRNRMIGYLLMFQDLTATREMELEIQKSKQLALVGEMAAGLAHEIRNPLASISGSIQMLRNNLLLDDTNARLIQIILRGRDQLEHLVKNFLLLSRPLKNQKKIINLSEIINEVIESIAHSEDWKRGIQVIKRTDTELPIYGNPNEIYQLLYNVVLNAVQAMPDGGILTFESKTVVDEANIELCISDTGCGMTEATLHKVFYPFYTTKETGTGLGLAIVNRIAQSHHGSIHLESVLHKGTLCRVRFPAQYEMNE